MTARARGPSRNPCKESAPVPLPESSLPRGWRRIARAAEEVQDPLGGQPGSSTSEPVAGRILGPPQGPRLEWRRARPEGGPTVKRSQTTASAVEPLPPRPMASQPRAKHPPDPPGSGRSRAGPLSEGERQAWQKIGFGCPVEKVDHVGRGAARVLDLHRRAVADARHVHSGVVRLRPLVLDETNEPRPSVRVRRATVPGATATGSSLRKRRPGGRARWAQAAQAPGCCGRR